MNFRQVAKESHFLPSEARPLDCRRTQATNKQRIDAMKFPMLQIVIMAKVQPNEHLYLRVRLEQETSRVMPKH